MARIFWSWSKKTWDSLSQLGMVIPPTMWVHTYYIYIYIHIIYIYTYIYIYYPTFDHGACVFNDTFWATFAKWLGFPCKLLLVQNAWAMHRQGQTPSHPLKRMTGREPPKTANCASKWRKQNHAANPLIFPLNASCMLKHAQAETSKTNSKAYAPLHTLEKKSETPSFWNLPLRCSYSCLTLPYKIRVWIPLIQQTPMTWMMKVGGASLKANCSSCCQSAVTDEAVNDVPSMDVQDDQSIDLHLSVWFRME